MIVIRGKHLKADNNSKVLKQPTIIKREVSWRFGVTSKTPKRFL